MKITNINNKQPVSFKAKEYACIKTCINSAVTAMNVYKLNYEDRVFLDVMSNNAIKNILKNPKNKAFSYKKEYINVINNAVLMSGFDEPQKSFLLVKNKKPCAMMTYKIYDGNCYLDCLTSWPAKTGQTVKLAGKSMIKLLYEDCEKNNVSKIFLDILHSSSDTLKNFYKSLGFLDSVSSNSDMYCTKTRYKEVKKQLDKLIKIDTIENPNQINLAKHMDINF